MNFYEAESISLYLDELSLLEEITSPKQRITLFLHPQLGKILTINHEIQHIEKFQALYHEPLVHLPACFISNLESVLILGGGSLFAAYEALKYPSVKLVVLCDYDHSVLQVMERHYTHVSSVINDKRFKYVERDASDFIKQTNLRFDLVINDCFNLIKQSHESNVSYYNLLENLCNEHGVCVDVIYRHVFDLHTTTESLQEIKKHSHIAFSLVFVPEYPGILHLETIWGKNRSINQCIRTTLNSFQNIVSPESFDFFNPNFLPFYFYLPPYISNMFTL